MLLHDRQKFDDDFRRRLQEHLSLAALLRVEHVLQGIVQHTDSHHRALPAAALSQHTHRPTERQTTARRRHETKVWFQRVTEGEGELNLQRTATEGR